MLTVGKRYGMKVEGAPWPFSFATVSEADENMLRLVDITGDARPGETKPGESLLVGKRYVQIATELPHEFQPGALVVTP